MSHEECILSNFVKGFVGNAMVISDLPEEYPAWTFKEETSIGVAIPLSPKNLTPYYGSSESITLKADPDMKIGQHKGLLLLFCAKTALSGQFAKICADFVSPSIREKVTEKPDEWWQGWRALMGDKLQDKKIYDILAELFVCEYLAKNKTKFDWAGPKRATIDIETTERSYEVKSSTVKDKWIFTASSDRQLDFEKRGNKEPKPLSLVFCQVEESDSGRSVNDVLANLKELGENVEKLESLLGMKFPQGSPLRDQKFILWKMREFNVDEKFPRITQKMLQDGILPAGIVAINSYQVDLSVIEGKDLI